MATPGWRFLPWLWVVLALAAGCASVPPAPPHAATTGPQGASTQSTTDDSDGWLFDRLTGRKPSQPQPQSTASPVVAASATASPGAAEPVVAATGSGVSSPAEPEPIVKDDEESPFDLAQLAPENIYKNIKKAAGYGPNEGIARTLMQEGKALLEQRKFAEAVGKFKSAADRWPDSILEEDAMFLLGESYFFSDQYPKAQDAYENLLKKYDNSRHLDTVTKRLFSIGQYWEKLHETHPHWPVTPNVTDKEQPWFDTFGNAIKCYDLVRMKDPTGQLADDALMATANAYFRKGRYEDAAFHYDILRKEYPSSEFQAKAHILNLQAKLHVYQGASYDRIPLDEAKEIAEQTLTQFPTELGDERDRVAQTRERIIEQQAERDFAQAQYYDKNKYYGAARMYYEYVIKEHPLTPYAQRARQRIEEIRGEPDVPPNHFKWLTNLFPSHE